MSGINSTLLATSDCFSLNLKSFSWESSKDYSNGHIANNNFENSLHVQSHTLSKRDIDNGAMVPIIALPIIAVVAVMVSYT